MNIKYQTQVCNDAILTTLLKLKCSGLDEEQLKMMLGCIGRTLCQISIDGRPIEYFIEHVTDYMIKGGTK